MIGRRSFLSGLLAAVAAPLVVKADVLMPLRGVKMLPFIDIPEWCPEGWVPTTGERVSKFQFPELHEWFTKTRQYRADEEGFNLPGEGGFGYIQSFYPEYAERLTIARPSNGQAVQLVSVRKMMWPNGRVANPGFLATIPGNKPGTDNLIAGRGRLQAQ